MRILIVGAGIAGLTLASLLKQRQIHADIIDKAHGFGDVGYMIGLYSLGSSVLHGLNLYDDYISRTQRLTTYVPHDNDGNQLKSFSLAEFTKRYGDYQCTTRYTLIEIIRQAYGDLPVQFGTMVTTIEQLTDETIVTFSNGNSKSYDLVIGSDGINSQIRSLILEQNEYETFDTGWGGFVWWGDKAVVPAETVYEFWGDKFFVGAYPTEEKTGLIIACKGHNAIEALQGKSRKEFLLDLCSPVVAKYPELFQELPADNVDMFYWGLKDVRCKVWHKGKVLLLGDAATAFLPTAGVGASMAMESAAVLNDILSRTDSRYLSNALNVYDKRRRKRVESAQEDSRKLAKMMFVDSYIGSKARDIVFKFMVNHMDMQDFMKSIANAMVTPA